jgi:mono/diheme cytochrome c family protein
MQIATATGLSTGYAIGLAVTGALFVTFSLISALVLPRRNPDFPGGHRNAFLAVSICFFIAMMAAVLYFGREPAESEAAEPETPTTETQPSETQPTETQPAETVPTGDAAAGKAVFSGSGGCTACHTLAAAGATGTVGPNLDETKPDLALITDRVENGKGGMPAFKGTLSDEEIADVAAFVYESTHA